MPPSNFYKVRCMLHILTKGSQVNRKVQKFNPKIAKNEP